MSTAERVSALERLLARIQKNAALPRPELKGSPAIASKPAVADAPPARARVELPRNAAVLAHVEEPTKLRPLSVDPKALFAATEAPGKTKDDGLDEIDVELEEIDTLIRGTVNEVITAAEKAARPPPEQSPFAKITADAARIVAEKRLASERVNAEKLAAGKRTEDDKRARAEKERIAAEKLAAEKSAAEKSAAGKLAAEKSAAEKRTEDDKRARAEQERIAADKLAADKLVADKLAADKLAADKLAADKLAADKLAADKLAADKLAADKLAADKLAADKLAVDKLAAEKLAAEKFAAEKRTEDEKLARAEQERIAADKLAAEKRAEDEKREQERIAAKKRADDDQLVRIEQQRVAAEKRAEDERLARAQRERIAAEKLGVEERIAREAAPTPGAAPEAKPMSSRVPRDRSRALDDALGDMLDEPLAQSGEVASKRQPTGLQQPPLPDAATLGAWTDDQDIVVPPPPAVPRRDTMRSVDSEPNEMPAIASLSLPESLLSPVVEVKIVTEPAPSSNRSREPVGRVPPMAVEISADSIRRKDSGPADATQFLGAIREFRPATFGDLLDASLSLGSGGPRA